MQFLTHVILISATIYSGFYIRPTQTDISFENISGKRKNRNMTQCHYQRSTPGLECGFRPPLHPLQETTNFIRGKRRRVRKYNPFMRIIGGEAVVGHPWPWMASIHMMRKKKIFLCGASLISRQYVLTAAHCFDHQIGNISPFQYIVRLGSNNINFGRGYWVASMIRHPNYVRLKLNLYDLSILKLANIVTLGPKVQPVCLPSKPYVPNQIDSNDLVTVTGWGEQKYRSNYSEILNEVQVRIIPLNECKKLYQEFRDVTDNFICAGDKNELKDSCKGDSGGPMVMEVEKGRWEQLGIISYGFGCATAEYPGMYTRMAKFKEWIYENTDLGKK